MANEYLKKLSGTKEEKKELFEMFTAKLLSGQVLTDSERAMFEYLRTELIGDEDGL